MSGDVGDNVSLRCRIVEIEDNEQSTEASGAVGIVSMPDSEAEERCEAFLKCQPQLTRIPSGSNNQRNEDIDMLPESDKQFIRNISVLNEQGFAQSNEANNDRIDATNEQHVRMPTVSYGQSNQENGTQNSDVREQLPKMSCNLYRPRNETHGFLIPETDKVLPPMGGNRREETERVPTPRWRKLLRSSRRKSLLSNRPSVRKPRSGRVSSGEGDIVTRKQATRVRWNVPERVYIPTDESEAGSYESEESEDYYKPARPIIVKGWNQHDRPPGHAPGAERRPPVTVARSSAADDPWVKRILRQIRGPTCATRGSYQNLPPAAPSEGCRERPSSGRRRGSSKSRLDSPRESRDDRPTSMSRKRSSSAYLPPHLDVIGPTFALTISRDNSSHKSRRPDERKHGVRWLKRPHKKSHGGGKRRRHSSPSADGCGRACEPPPPTCQGPARMPLALLPYDTGPAGQLAAGRQSQSFSYTPFKRQSSQGYVTPGMAPERASGMPPERVSGMPPERVSGMPPERVSGMPPERASGMPPEMINGMASEPASVMNPNNAPQRFSTGPGPEPGGMGPPAGVSNFGGSCTSGPPGHCGFFPKGTCGGGPLGSCGVPGCGSGAGPNTGGPGYGNAGMGPDAGACGSGPHGLCGSGTPGGCGRQTCGPARRSAQPGEDFNPMGNYNPQPMGTYNPQPMGDYNAQPMGSYSAQPTGSYSAQPMGNYNAQPMGSYSAQPMGNYNAQPMASYSAQPMGSYNPQPVNNFNAQPVMTYNAQNMGMYNPQQTGNASPQPMKCGAGGPGTCMGGPPGSCGVPTCGKAPAKRATFPEDESGVPSAKKDNSQASMRKKSSTSSSSQKSVGGASVKSTRASLQKTQKGGFTCNKETCGSGHRGSCEVRCCACSARASNKNEGSKSVNNPGNPSSTDNSSISTNGNVTSKSDVSESKQENSKSDDLDSRKNDEDTASASEEPAKSDLDVASDERSRSESDENVNKYRPRGVPCARRRNRQIRRPCSMLYVVETPQQSGYGGNGKSSMAPCQFLELPSATGRQPMLALALPPPFPEEALAPFGRAFSVPETPLREDDANKCPVSSRRRRPPDWTKTGKSAGYPPQEFPTGGWNPDILSTFDAFRLQKHLMSPSYYPSGAPPGTVGGAYGSPGMSPDAPFGDCQWPRSRGRGVALPLGAVYRRGPRCQILSRSPLAPRPDHLATHARPRGPQQPRPQAMSPAMHLVPYTGGGNWRVGGICPSHGRVMPPRPILPQPHPISIVYSGPPIYRRSPAAPAWQFGPAPAAAATCTYSRPPSTTMAQFLRAVAASCPTRVQPLTHAEAVPWRQFEDASAGAREDGGPKGRSRLRNTVARLKRSFTGGSAKSKG